MGSTIQLELRRTTEENGALFKGETFYYISKWIWLLKSENVGYLLMAFKSGTEQPIGSFKSISNGQTLDCSGGMMVINMD